MNPWGDDHNRLAKQNALTGHVEQQHFSEFSFREQQRSFHVLGYAANPSLNAGVDGETPAVVGNVHEAYRNQGASVSQVKPLRKDVRETKRRRMGKGKVGVFDDPDDEDEEEQVDGGNEGQDGDAPQEGDAAAASGAAGKRKKAKKEQKEYLGPWAGWEGENLSVAVPTEEEYEEQELAGGPLLNKQERRKKLLEDANRKEIGFGEEKSVFHGAFAAQSVALSLPLNPERRKLNSLCPPSRRQGDSRLPRKDLPPRPARRRRRQPPWRVGRTRVLRSEEVRPHVVGAHEGGLAHPAFPGKWSLDPVWFSRHSHQGRYSTRLVKRVSKCSH